MLTEEGLPCVFPFQMKGMNHSECVYMKKENKSMCSLTENYDVDKKSGYCEMGKVANDAMSKWCGTKCFMPKNMCDPKKCKCFKILPGPLPLYGPKAGRRISFDQILPKEPVDEVDVHALTMAMSKLLQDIRQLLALMSSPRITNVNDYDDKPSNQTLTTAPSVENDSDNATATSNITETGNTIEDHEPSMRSSRQAAKGGWQAVDQGSEQLNTALVDQLTLLERKLSDDMDMMSIEEDELDIASHVVLLKEDLNITKATIANIEVDYFHKVSDHDPKVLEAFATIKKSFQEVYAELENVEKDMALYERRITATAIRDALPGCNIMCKILMASFAGMAMNVCCLLFLRWLHHDSGKLKNWTDKFVHPWQAMDYVSNFVCVIVPYVSIPITFAANLIRKKTYKKHMDHEPDIFFTTNDEKPITLHEEHATI